MARASTNVNVWAVVCGSEAVQQALMNRGGLDGPQDTLKLYAYADETGQESAGRIFLVAVVVVGSERDALLPWLEDLEAQTGKGRLPWRRSRPTARTAYVERILAERGLAGAVLYTTYAGTRDYRDLTTMTMANAVATRAAGRRFKVTVIIDGLRRDEVHAVSWDFGVSASPSARSEGRVTSATPEAGWRTPWPGSSATRRKGRRSGVRRWPAPWRAGSCGASDR